MFVFNTAKDVSAASVDNDETKFEIAQPLDASVYDVRGTETTMLFINASSTRTREDNSP